MSVIKSTRKLAKKMLGWKALGVNDKLCQRQWNEQLRESTIRHNRPIIALGVREEKRREDVAHM